MLPSTDYSTLHRVLVLIGAVAVLGSVIGNLTYARRNVTLNIELVTAANKLQEVNATQQQVNAIAQDLVSFAPRFPWLVPYLEKYGLVHVQQAPPNPTGATQKGGR